MNKQMSWTPKVGLQRTPSVIAGLSVDAITPRSAITPNNVSTPDKSEEVVPAKGGISRLIKEHGGGTALYLIFGVIGAVGNGVMTPIFFIFFGDLFGTGTSGDDVDYKSEALRFMVTFLVVGVAFLVFNALQYVCWGIYGSKISVKARKQYFHCLLQQDVGYYDEKSSGAINTELISDCLYIAGVGTAIGLAIQHTVTFVGSFVLAF